MNINVNIRNKTKFVEKIKVEYLQIHTTLADNTLSYKTWYQIKVET